MKLSYFKILLITLVLLIPFFAFGILNTMVSLKYETDNPAECISKISGVNLCNALRNMKIYIAIDVIIIVFLLILKNKIVKKNVA